MLRVCWKSENSRQLRRSVFPIWCSCCRCKNQQAYALQRVQIDFGVEELIVVVVVEAPLGDESVYGRGVAHKTCSKKVRVSRNKSGEMCKQGRIVRRIKHICSDCWRWSREIKQQIFTFLVSGTAFGSSELPVHFKFKPSWQHQLHFSILSLFFPLFSCSRTSTMATDCRVGLCCCCLAFCALLFSKRWKQVLHAGTVLVERRNYFRTASASQRSRKKWLLFCE